MTAKEERLRGHLSQVMALAFSPNGENLATGTENGELILRDLGARKNTTLKGHAGSVTDISYSKEGDHWVTAGTDNGVMVWDRAGQPLKEFVFSRPVSRASISPKGDMIAVAGNATHVELRQLNGSTPRSRLKGHLGPVTDILFSPDGKRVASASLDRTIALWPLNPLGKPVFLRGHREAALSLTFSPDSKFLLSGSSDQTLRLWNVQDGTLQAEYKAHDVGVARVAFASMRWIVSAGVRQRNTRLGPGAPDDPDCSPWASGTGDRCSVQPRQRHPGLSQYRRHPSECGLESPGLKPE